MAQGRKEGRDGTVGDVGGGEGRPLEGTEHTTMDPSRFALGTSARHAHPILEREGKERDARCVLAAVSAFARTRSDGFRSILVGGSLHPRPSLPSRFEVFRDSSRKETDPSSADHATDFVRIRRRGDPENARDGTPRLRPPCLSVVSRPIAEPLVGHAAGSRIPPTEGGGRDSFGPGMLRTTIERSTKDGQAFGSHETRTLRHVAVGSGSLERDGTVREGCVRAIGIVDRASMVPRGRIEKKGSASYFVPSNQKTFPPSKVVRPTRDAARNRVRSVLARRRRKGKKPSVFFLRRAHRFYFSFPRSSS